MREDVNGADVAAPGQCGADLVDAVGVRVQPDDLKRAAVAIECVEELLGVVDAGVDEDDFLPVSLRGLGGRVDDGRAVEQADFGAGRGGVQPGGHQVGRVEQPGLHGFELGAEAWRHRAIGTGA